jgi:hypothetical protein
MRLELNLVRRAGRGRPRRSVEQAIQTLGLAQAINEEVDSGAKLYIATEAVAKKKGKARSTAYVALATAKRAKAVRENN